MICAACAFTYWRFYIVGRGKNKDQKRILKIDRSEPSELVLVEDPTVYTARQCSALLQQLAEGNRSSGGLRLVTKAYGIVGCVRFLEPWYLILVRRRRQVGCMRGHAVFRIEESLVLTVPHASVHTSVASSTMEQRYKRLLSGVDLTKDFFYSHSYPVMRSLQDNVCRTVAGCTECGSSCMSHMDHMAHMAHEHMFVWNAFLTRPIRHALGTNRWTLTLSHGFFHQERMSIFGRVISLVLIARRSRHFAGTRYLKRGVNDRGRVANEVEVEQLLLDHSHEPILPPPTALHREPILPTALHRDAAVTSSPAEATAVAAAAAAAAAAAVAVAAVGAASAAAVPAMASVVQVRGSIPLFWSQQASRLSPKPDIVCEWCCAVGEWRSAVGEWRSAVVHRYDPMYTAARLHFENLMERYGRPIIILNLIKVQCGAVRDATVPSALLTSWSDSGEPSEGDDLKAAACYLEKHPREMILRREFAMAVAYLNRVLPRPSALTYIHWDFSRYAKSANAGTTPAGVTSAAASALSTLTTTPNVPTIPNTPTTLHTLTSHPSPFSSFPSSSLIPSSSSLIPSSSSLIPSSSSLIPPSSPSASSFSLSPPSLSPRTTNTSGTNVQASSGSGNSTSASAENGSSSGSKGSVAEGVLGALAAIARECLAKTGFFYSGQLASSLTSSSPLFWPAPQLVTEHALLLTCMPFVSSSPLFPISSMPPVLCSSSHVPPSPLCPITCLVSTSPGLPPRLASLSAPPPLPLSHFLPLPLLCLPSPLRLPLPCLPNACNLPRAATKTCFSSRPAAPPAAAAAAAVPSTTRPEEGGGIRPSSKGGAAAAAAAAQEEEAGRWVRPPQLQQGIVRTNCLDCLDRTNVAQFVFGREALAHQLYSLGITDSPHLDSKSDVGRRLQGMYIAMGDALALQYGGSAAHNLVIAERPGTWRSTLQSQEVLKSLHRYYSNAITDAEKQDAINLFLGHFQPWAGQAAMWEVGSDQHLHGATGRGAQAGEVGAEQGQLGLSGGRGVEGGGMMGAAAMPSASFSPSLASLPDVSDAPPPPMDLALLPSHVLASLPDVSDAPRMDLSLLPPQCVTSPLALPFLPPNKTSQKSSSLPPHSNPTAYRRFLCHLKDRPLLLPPSLPLLPPSSPLTSFDRLLGAGAAAAGGGTAVRVYPENSRGSGSQGGGLRKEGGDRGVQDWRGVRGGGEVRGGGKGLGRGRGAEVVDPREWAGELKECGFLASISSSATRGARGEVSWGHYLASVPSLIPGNTLASVGGDGAHTHEQSGMQGAWPLELQGFGALNSPGATRGGGEGPRLDEMLGGWAVAEAAVEDARRAEEAQEVVRKEAELLGGDYGVSVPHVLPTVVCAGLMDGWLAQGQADMRAPFQPLPY
ncbi:unnamed protein product [Closterium sp. NIES-64]|nr:unnamed protein product [Closterium sp. NIES-64]